MKTFKIKEGSWHYILATKYSTFYPHDEEMNLCAYVKYVLRGLCMALFATVVFGAFSVGVELLIISGLVWAKTGVFLLDGGQIIIIAMIGAIALMSICVFLSHFIIKAWETVAYQAAVREPGFISTAWKNFKDKTCAKIEIDD